MTEWDFFSEVCKWLFDATGFADRLFGAIFLIFIVLLIVEMLPGKAKPLSRTAAAIGKAFNAATNQRIDVLEKQLKKTEKDNVRTQFLMLIHDYPDNDNEILEVARHYFVDLKGDWYMTSLFNDWLKKYEHGEPEWFDSSK